jgi:hypothetical protein
MIKKRIIYNEFFNEHRLKIIDHLNKKNDWEPIFMFGRRPDKESNFWINKKFPLCVVKDSIDMRQAQFDYSNIGQVKPIDAEILSSISNYCLNYISNFSDPTGNNFSYDERKSYYFDILKYWNTVIQNLKPDIFVSYVHPHTPTCLSLYLLCKHHYNIDVLFVDFNPLLNNHSYMISSSIKNYETISKIYKSPENIIPGPVTKNYLESIRKKEAKGPIAVIEDLKMLEKKSKIVQRFKQFFSIIIRTLSYGYGFKIDGDWKKNIKPYHNKKSRMNNFEEFFFTEKIRHENKKLKKIYDKFITKVDFTKKYVYFAAQYQPEATNSIVGSYYENFFLVLDILSAAIPNDWIIYYKENPSTFNNASVMRGSLRRDKYYYERLAQYKNIKMISEKINTFDLIDHAQVVSTVTGTAAWEAVVRGVPSMSFGSIWYTGCDSIFFIKTFKDAEEAIKKILNGYKPDQKDIERYTACIEKVSSTRILPFWNFDNQIKKHENSDEVLIKIAEAINDAYIRDYS